MAVDRGDVPGGLLHLDLSPQPPRIAPQAAVRRRPSVWQSLNKPMNMCDKIVLFLGALMSSSLFAFHHMIPSPWDLVYVVLGCLMMPAIFFLILMRHVPHKSEEKYHVSRVWARTAYDADIAHRTLAISRVRIAGTKGGKGMIQDVGLIGEQCAVECSTTNCVCCLTDFRRGDALAVLPCGHMFCEACIVGWSFSGRASSRLCPICRSDFRRRSPESRVPPQVVGNMV
ncbi:E3 ubiquitin-protein ligase RNF103 (KF-1) (hKF-1) (RING finger protein 103) (RING-type E3 ubiquitin transferase RNF103) (Zinc finger protein 103 homolog) (Zfp-103) [Durusdinium trenchii]|uniref:E3 ubiquitin-protein ligase RNF103 (KF-1) (HKF-1) (RING finger protein 103) (RING-type E3 ubiquitin transferase RNF103) (Zinc finger protein 103 homolog) (Zfp-103) n=1 Tax=Durusdinium trenchii TaxID=1381693 RepID=A0ABP0RAU8_9DINO